MADNLTDALDRLLLAGKQLPPYVKVDAPAEAVEEGWLEALAFQRRPERQAELHAAVEALGKQTTDDNYDRLAALHQAMTS